jgi:Pyruvate/2-oxoacid:ferredoxin oxidoreductase gamma subunit
LGRLLRRFVRAGFVTLKSKLFEVEKKGQLSSLSITPQIRPKNFRNVRESNMAEMDVDALIRSTGKKQHKAVMEAARKRHARLMALAAKAKDKAAKDRLRSTAKSTLVMATVAARRLQITAENAAESYARSMKKAIEEIRQAAEKSAKASKKKKHQS